MIGSGLRPRTSAATPWTQPKGRPMGNLRKGARGETRRFKLLKRSDLMHPTLKPMKRMRRTVGRATLARACASLTVLAIMTPAYAQKLPAELAEEMVTQSIGSDGSTLRFSEIDRESPGTQP